MSSFWRKIKEMLIPDENESSNIGEIDVSYPTEKPIDEKFAEYFVKGGGHFLYCDSNQEVLKYLKQIINDEKIGRFICFDEDLQLSLDAVGAHYIDYPSASADCSFISCENLIAYNGSIMVSSKNTSGRKLSELPDTFIIQSCYDQIVDSLQDAMQIMNRRKGNNNQGFPSNITSIGGIESKPLGGLNAQKEIYLLLRD